MPSKKKPPAMKNQAVMAVGASYFEISMVGLIIATILGIATLVVGSTRGMFKFELDRCDCLLDSSSPAQSFAGESCVFGNDRMEVSIGWKSFVIDEAISTEGCLDGMKGTTGIGQPFGDGKYKKKSATYGNGATGAADACVGLFVVSAVLCIVLYKTVRMSYTGPGSIYTIGLHNVAVMCMLLSIASAISISAFWGRIQGKLGSLKSSLGETLFEAVLDVCEEDWDEVEEGKFCESRPWFFEVPLYAGWMAIAHVVVLALTSGWILSKSSFVEGILDGSVLADGKKSGPRIVEYEQAVGRALATEEDPDFDAENLLYAGEQNIMIRPYPLPGTVKTITKVAEALVSPLRRLTPSPSPKSRKPNGDPEGKGSVPPSDTDGQLDGSFSPESTPGREPQEHNVPLSKAEEKAAKKAARKKAKQQQGSHGRSMSFGRKSPEPKHSSEVNWSSVDDSLEDKIHVVDHSREENNSFSATGSPGPTGEVGGAGSPGHGKTRSEIDWRSIMNREEEFDSEDIDPESPVLRDMRIGHLPSARSGLSLGAITEDPMEDMTSEFAVSPKTGGKGSRFEM